jgi:glycosyltransferase involved in cell wall biosynthesis
MKIGIDISQIVYEGTGVANLLSKLVEHLLRVDKENEYTLFFSSLRKKTQNSIPIISGQNYNSKVKIKELRFPPTVLDILWNRLHIFPIEWFIGDVDLFITSDWTEPPTIKAKKATILYDLIVYKTPHETDSKIVSVQKRKLMWVKKESDIIFCISEATKKDAMEILGIEEKRLKVIYPGI